MNQIRTKVFILNFHGIEAKDQGRAEDDLYFKVFAPLMDYFSCDLIRPKNKYHSNGMLIVVKLLIHEIATFITEE